MPPNSALVFDDLLASDPEGKIGAVIPVRLNGTVGGRVDVFELFGRPEGNLTALCTGNYSNVCTLSVSGNVPTITLP